MKDLANALRRAAKGLRATHQERAIGVASDLHAMIRDRVIQSGTDSDGRKFPAYSTAPVPKFYYFGRSRNNGADQKVRKLKKKTLSYREFRTINGLQVAHVDLFFTGGMWRGTGVRIKNREADLVTVEILGKTEESREKLTWNNLRYKTNILAPSESELAIARRTYAFRASQIISNEIKK